MIILALLTIAAVYAVVWGFSNEYSRGAMTAAIGGSVALVFLLAFLLVGAVNWLGFPADMRRATETRSAVAQLGCNASEDVMGTALAFNRDLTSAKYWRTRWYASWQYAPGVDTASPIAIPECR
jgi:hypothetical protein